MSSDSQVLLIRVDRALKARVSAAAAARGRPVASELRALLTSHYQAEPGPSDGMSARDGQAALPPRRRRDAVVRVKLSAAEKAAIEARADSFGGISAWIRGAIEARLQADTALVTGEETRALYAAVSELSAVGRNVNQIARQMNIAAQHGQPPSYARTVVATVGELAEKMTAVVRETRAIVAAARRRGRVTG